MAKDSISVSNAQLLREKWFNTGTIAGIGIGATAAAGLALLHPIIPFVVGIPVLVTGVHLSEKLRRKLARTKRPTGVDSPPPDDAR